MSYTVSWTLAAIADLQQIRQYIGNFNPHAARAMAVTILETANGLTDFPYRGRQVAGTELRETALAYPYLIRYRIEGDSVLILRVRHGRQQRLPP